MFQLQAYSLHLMKFCAFKKYTIFVNNKTNIWVEGCVQKVY